MEHKSPMQSAFTPAEFEALAEALLGHAPRMTDGQMLDLADRLHALIRSRRVVERSFARRHAAGAAPALRMLS